MKSTTSTTSTISTTSTTSTISTILTTSTTSTTTTTKSTTSATHISSLIHTCRPSKRVRHSWLWHYIYTIYLSLFTQTAAPNHFRGTHSSPAILEIVSIMICIFHPYNKTHFENLDISCHSQEITDADINWNSIVHTPMSSWGLLISSKKGLFLSLLETLRSADLPSSRL